MSTRSKKTESTQCSTTPEADAPGLLTWEQHRTLCPSFDEEGFPNGSCHLTTPVKPCRAGACLMIRTLRFSWYRSWFPS